MSDEIKERPDKPGIWQRDGGINPISLVYANEADRLMVISTSGYCRPNDEALARWRLIIDSDGKQVCDPEKPWPPKTRVEKRWFHFDKRTQELGLATFPCDNCVELACEVDESDKVIRVLKDGE